MKRKQFTVVIDGPAGVGKSTVAKMVAGRIGFNCFDTGATYRAVAWKVLKESIDPEDKEGVERVANSISLDLKYYPEKGLRAFVDGEEVMDEIRHPDVERVASLISTYPGVREVLVRMQREICLREPTVVEGRDIQTVVLPDAEVKIFLVASLEERARRRYIDLIARGMRWPFEEVKREIEERDRRDMTREVAPLRPSPDAFVIDSTPNFVGETVERAVWLVKRRMEERK